jgi:predicted P-loop ATPase
MGFVDFQRALKTNLPDPTNPDNVRIFCMMYHINVRWNDWARRIEVSESTNAQHMRDEMGAWEPLTDAHIKRWMTLAGDTQHQFRPADLLFRRVIETRARESPYDPVLDHLTAVQATWDCTPRLDTWLSRACGVPDDAYQRAVARNIVGGMVKRARHPGCKHDEVAILIGDQGAGKSELCHIVASHPEWFSDSVAFDGRPQDVIPQLFGKWVVELSELDGMARRDVKHVKRFISTQSDNYTAKYEALAADNPRRCIFIGTSNDESPLVDLTGNRRWLPVRIPGALDLDWLRGNWDQILGEAAYWEWKGQTFGMPREIWGVAAERQTAATERPAWETHLREWFAESPTPVYVTPADLLTLATDANSGRSPKRSEYTKIMRTLGFGSRTKRVDNKPVEVWFRGDLTAAYRIVPRIEHGRMVPRLAMDVAPAPAGRPGATNVPASNVTATPPSPPR